MGAQRDRQSPSSGLLYLPDDSEFDLAKLLDDIKIVNQVDDVVALRVDSQSIESSHIDTYSGSQDGATLVSASSGEEITIHDVILTVDAPAGQIAVDFSGGDVVSRLYSSQFQRLILTSLTKTGPAGEDLELTASDLGDGDELFVAINYIKE